MDPKMGRKGNRSEVTITKQFDMIDSGFCSDTKIFEKGNLLEGIIQRTATPRHPLSLYTVLPDRLQQLTKLVHLYARTTSLIHLSIEQDIRNLVLDTLSFGCDLSSRGWWR